MNNADGDLQWISARDTRAMFVRATGGMRGRGGQPIEVAIAELAFVPGNAMRTKAASVTVDDDGAANVIDADGMLPNTFWEPVCVKIWAASSDWSLGVVAGHYKDLRAIAHGVMFCAEDMERLTGLTPSARMPAAPRPAAIDPTVTQERVPGGRPSDKHGEPIAAVTIRLIKMDDAELTKWTGDALGPELAAAYKAIGAPPPAGKNLEGICWGILRAVRKAKENGV